MTAKPNASLTIVWRVIIITFIITLVALVVSFPKSFEEIAMDDKTLSETTGSSSAVDRLLFLLPFLAFLVTWLLVRSGRTKRRPDFTRYVPPSLTVRGDGGAFQSSEDGSGALFAPPGTPLTITVTLIQPISDSRDRVDVDVRYAYFQDQRPHSRPIDNHAFPFPSVSHIIQTTVPSEAGHWDNVTIEAHGKSSHNNVPYEEGTDHHPIKTKP